MKLDALDSTQKDIEFENQEGNQQNEELEHPSKTMQMN